MKCRAPKYLLLASLAVVGLGAVSFNKFKPKIVWNGSKSAPIGVYTVRHRAFELNDYVLVKPSGAIENFIVRRRILPPQTPLLKRIAAMPGEEVCRNDNKILIEKIVVAYALEVDSVGREMPVWNGCVTLRSQEVFLLNDQQRSLDGRYFGVTNINTIIGVARPIWVKRQRFKNPRVK